MESPLTIVEYCEDENLRYVGWSQRFLEAQKERYALKHQQAILYVNKARDRFRLIACFYGLAVLVLPPTDPEQRLSIYLKVSQFLRKISEGRTAYDFLEQEIENTKERIGRRDDAVAAAQKRKRGKK